MYLNICGYPREAAFNGTGLQTCAFLFAMRPQQPQMNCGLLASLRIFSISTWPAVFESVQMQVFLAAWPQQSVVVLVVGQQVVFLAGMRASFFLLSNLTADTHACARVFGTDGIDQVPLFIENYGQGTGLCGRDAARNIPLHHGGWLAFAHGNGVWPIFDE